MPNARNRRSSFQGTATFLFVLTLCSVGRTLTVRAQDAVPESPSAPATAAAPPAGNDARADWERLIYVPYRNLKTVFEKEGSTVFLPYSRFLPLWEKFQESNGSRSAAPPVNSVITSASYTGRIEKDLAHLDVELTIQVLGKPWVETPIQFGDAAIARMTASDEKVLLQGTGNGGYVLLFPKAGEHKVRFELSTRVRTSPDGRSLEFDCPAAGITSFDLSVPAADQSIDIIPQGVVTATEGGETLTRVKANLGATRKISARWRPRVSTMPVMEVLTSVDNTLDVRIADGLMHTHATLRYQILRGQLDQLRIAVPLDHRILDVTAAGLKSWKATREDEWQLVTVDLLGGDARSVVVDVHTERPLPEGPFIPAGVDDDGAYHGVHALGEVREHGLLVVGQGADLSLSVDHQSGLMRVEAGEVPEAFRRPDYAFYKFYTPKFRLQLSARPIEPRLLVDHRTDLVFREEELQSTSRLQYTVERAGVFELRLTLPAEFIVDRVDCEAMKEFQTPEGSGQLIILLREKTLRPLSVVISGHRPLDATQKEAAPLPLIEPLGVARENGVIAVYAPESLEVIADEKGVKGAQPTRLEPREMIQVPSARLVSSWTYTRRPEIPVRTERKPTRLAVGVATTVDVRQDLTEVTTLLKYNVQFAGIDTFRLAVPEAVADAVQIESTGDAAIRQKSRAAEATDGWVVWTVVLQREVVGPLVLRVRYDLKPTDEGKGARVSIMPLRALETPGRTEGAPVITTASISGEIVVQKDRQLSLTASAEGLEPIDVRELTQLPQDGYLAYRYFKQPDQLASRFALDLSAVRNEIQPVVETVISQALVEAVVTEDKSVTYRCRYRLKTSERQRLAIDLPQDVEILDALVAGKRVDLEKGENGSSSEWDSFKVNVARSTPSDEPFVLALVFRAPFKDSPLRGRGGNLKLPLPRIGGGQQKSNVAIQQLRTAIWVPWEYSLVGVPVTFTPDRPTRFDLIHGAVGYDRKTDELEQWFGESGGGLFAFSPAGKAYRFHRLGSPAVLELSYWKTAWFTWTISGALFLVALFLVKTSWENRLTIVLFAAFGAAMYALRDADIVANLIGAARFGLLAMGAYWLIHAITRPRVVVSGHPVIPYATVPPSPERPAEQSPPNPSSGPPQPET